MIVCAGAYVYYASLHILSSSEPAHCWPLLGQACAIQRWWPGPSPHFPPFLRLLGGRDRDVGSFLACGGVFEVCLARLAESVFDPMRGLAQLMQTAEAFCIYLAGRFSCSVVCASDAVHPRFMLYWRRWLVRFPVSGGCYEISYGIPLVP